MLQNIARLQGSEQDLIPGWFERSKQLMLISEAMDQETASEQAATAALDELYGMGYDYHLKAPEKIRAVELNDIGIVSSIRLSRAVITISTPNPDLVEIEPGTRQYEQLPPVDLTPKGVEHDTAQ